MSIHPAVRARHLSLERVLLVALVAAVAFAALSGVRISWPTTTDVGTTSSATVTTTSVAAQQVDPIGTSATIEARQELRGLRELVRSTPSLGTSLAEEIATLEAIARGHVPSRTNTR